MRKVLIIDDEEKLRTLLARIISLEGFEVLQADDCKGAWKKLDQSEVDVILCGNIPDGVQAMKNGAFDYITKGDDNNKIIPLLYRAMEKVDLGKKVQQLEKQLSDKHSFDKIIGKSKPIQKAIELARKVAATDTTVLLTGETGTGKEVFAQAIHQESKRNRNNFVAINCAAFSKELLESEMFGHKAGAFTGANKDRKGLFEEANNGTIFLDEIGEMPLELQAKLLRVLETNEFIRVGESKPTKINVRIIAATHRDLQKEIELGHFREDLFYRIAVFQIELPPLRERVIDIEDLANYFLKSFLFKANKKVTSISKEYIEAPMEWQFSSTKKYN